MVAHQRHRKKYFRMVKFFKVRIFIYLFIFFNIICYFEFFYEKIHKYTKRFEKKNAHGAATP